MVFFVLCKKDSSQVGVLPFFRLPGVAGCPEGCRSQERDAVWPVETLPN